VENALKLIIVGFVLLLVGVVLPFLMVLGLVESTLLLSFLAYGSSTAGLILGFVGIAQYSRGRK
jgi:hypothetical protein